MADSDVLQAAMGAVYALHARYESGVDAWKVALEAAGVPWASLYVFLCICATVPLSYPLRHLRRPRTRQLYAAASGLGLCYVAFGAHGCIHMLATLAYAYGLMVLNRRHCGLAVFVVAFAHLIYCHVMNASGAARLEGKVDFTGSQMVLTLKVISLAFSYQDGEVLPVDSEKLSEGQLARRVMKLPDLVEYLGYIFMGGSLLVGPTYEFRDYDDFMHWRGPWDAALHGPLPSAAAAATAAVQVASISLVSLIMLAVLTPRFPLDYLTSSAFIHGTHLVAKVPILFAYALVASRLKFYAAWSMGEAAFRLCGFAFSGYAATALGPDKLVPKWERTLNVKVLGVEACTSGAGLPAVWNIGTSLWLRVYVYERLTVRGGRPTFWTLLATQVVSGVWHGLYPGFWLFFVSSAVMLNASKVIYKWQQALPPAARPLGTAVHWAIAQTNLNYLSVAFILLDFSSTMRVWRSLYYTPHLTMVTVCVLGAMIKPPKPWGADKAGKLRLKTAGPTRPDAGEKKARKKAN